ncbi:MAG: ABC transporter ATP-binding protein, partial [Ignavibacteria bacterium]|nr:ABC transporter ATP-binding protein [Ignavibacteria bacterium]
PNGAGKSTTIRMMTSLIHPDNGEILIFGLPLKKHFKSVLKKVGAIVEKPDFYLYLTAYKNLEILAKLYGIDPTKKQIMEVLEIVRLENRYRSKVKTFSHGMKQRLGIAQALLHNPELIILDEPTTGLDPQGMKEIRDLIVYLAKEKNKTIFLSSHLLNEVEQVANRMIILNKGKVAVEGYVSELLNKENADYVFRMGNFQKAFELLSERGLKHEEDYLIQNEELILKTRKISASDFNKLLVQNGVEVFSFSPKTNLEEFFLKITQEGSI